MGRDLETWLKTTVEEALEPELEIIDPHIHLWDFTREPRGTNSTVVKAVKIFPKSLHQGLIKKLFPAAPLLAFSKHAAIMHRFELENFKAGFGGHNVVKTVHIESGWEQPRVAPELKALGETNRCAERMKAEEKASSGFELNFVCFVDLRLGKKKVGKGLDAHLKASKRVVGVRHQIAFDSNKKIYNAPVADKGMTATPKFRGGLKALIERNLSYDCWCHYHQLDEVAEIAKDLPELKIILDHVGGLLGVGKYSSPAAREKMKADWTIGIKNLAQYSNVVVKLSGICMPICGTEFFKGNKAPSSDEVVELMFPYIQTVVEAFGVDRCMFASNFPVDKVNVSYTVLYNAFKKCCNKMGITDEDKKKLFRDNAARVYKF